MARKNKLSFGAVSESEQIAAIVQSAWAVIADDNASDLKKLKARLTLERLGKN